MRLLVWEGTGRPATTTGSAAVPPKLGPPSPLIITSTRCHAVDSVLQFASSSFDASTWEICGALLTGATLVVPEPGVLAGERLSAVLETHRVTHVTLLPAAPTDLVTPPHLTRYLCTASSPLLTAGASCGRSEGTTAASITRIGRFPMSTQAVLYVVAIIFLVLAALPVPRRGIRFAPLGAAAALAAYAWPVLTHLTPAAQDTKERKVRR